MGRTTGVTLVELAIYSALTIVVSGMMLSVMVVGATTYAEQRKIGSASERSRALQHRLAEDLRLSMEGTAVVSPDGRSLTVTVPEGVGPEGVLPGPVIRYDLEIAGDEKPNGVDDNGNGVIDEGQVRRTNATTNDSFLVASGIDLARSEFFVIGNAIRCSIALVFASPTDRAPRVERLEFTVSPRN